MNTHTTNLPAIETHTFPNSHIISCLNLNLAQIAASGQCFRMLPVPEKPGIWSLISGTHYLEISETPDGFFFDCPDEALPFWKQYFDLGTDYGSFIASIRADDAYLAAAADAGSGIRILRQDLWEMMITFLISQQKTIPKIREAVETLAKKYGAKRTAALSDGSIRTYYSFPSPEELASASLDDLLALKLGYRAKYIHRLIQDVLAGTVSLESLAALPPDEAMTALTSLYGIGPKVANCVCLFGLHHIDAFPVDTWIEQILTKEYLPKQPIRYRRLPKSRLYTTIIQDFFGSYKGYAGVMQQYIFYYERSIRNGKF
jgi:N-glycosylase/DNA lyase